MSAPMHDFDALNRNALAACPDLLHRLLPGGRLFGHEFQAGSLQGEKGGSLSVNIRTGRWSDFATGEKGGDLIDLIAQKDRLSLGEAHRALSDMLGLGDAMPSRPLAEVVPLRPAAPAEGDWVQAMMPPPGDAPQPPTTHYSYGEPEHTAEVRDQSGALLHLILRFPASERTGGRKMIQPLTYGTRLVKKGSPAVLVSVTGWHWKAPPPARPLYGLPLQDDAPVLVVEGEVKRDAAQRLLPGWSVVSWPGGAKAIGRADWSPLQGRDVTMWPDADAPGADAAAAVINQLRGIAAEVRAVTPPEGKGDGWDLADAEREGWSGQDVLNHIAPLDPDERDEPAEDPRDEVGGLPFRALGHDRQIYYFLPQGAGQVIGLSAKDCHNRASLMMLADRQWWETQYTGPKGQPFSIDRAGNDLIQACHAIGIFDPDRQRGRGVWIDNNRTVLHLGDRLLCNGDEFNPAAFPSEFVYEAARPIDTVPGEPLTDREAAGLLRLCCGVAWEEPDRDGRFVAGWVVAAMICGALPWRPHLWVVSESGKGKSWVEDNILKMILGPMALRVQSKTTEPAIRRTLRVDARPVLFDEAETQNRRDADNMQQVIDLSRAASAENGADILKADTSKGAGVVRYSIRSCFYFSAINLAITQAADESRAIVATLRPSPETEVAAAQFARLKQIHAEVMVPEFGLRLLARTLGLIPVIRHNIEMLASAIARGGVSRRTGDTLGVILACAYSLTSSAKMTNETAAEFLASRAWVKQAAAERESEPEWKRALSRLLQQDIRFTSGNGRVENAPGSELIDAIVNPVSDRGVPVDTAEKALARAGMRIMGGELRIAYQSVFVAQAFADTPWQQGWRETLVRTPGGRRNVPVKMAGLNDKAVAIPLRSFLEGVP